MKRRCNPMKKHSSYITHLDVSRDSCFLQSTCGASKFCSGTLTTGSKLPVEPLCLRTNDGPVGLVISVGQFREYTQSVKTVPSSTQWIFPTSQSTKHYTKMTKRVHSFWQVVTIKEKYVYTNIPAP